MQVTTTKEPLSWGRVFRHEQQLITPHWRSDLPGAIDLVPADSTFLPYGLGRSYGDSCLNSNGILLQMSGVRRIRSFDREKGLLVADAGVTLAEILKVIVPAGWFLPVTPGTKYVTLGGAVANDVHGKNHHVAGTFGCHVPWMELMTSSGEVVTISPAESPELFAATIGGMGLTGIIRTVALNLQPIASPWMRVETLVIKNIDDYFAKAEESDKLFPYTVAWVDCLAGGADLGKGLLMRGEHAPQGTGPDKGPRSLPKVAIPISAPSWLLGRATVGAFNKLYFQMGTRKAGVNFEAFDPFFYPLDGVLQWNKMYGRKGFYQLQIAVPLTETQVITQTLEQVAKWGTSSFLVVLKRFGNKPSPGLLSYPREGYTLTLDFPATGGVTRERIRELMEKAVAAGGAIYPAKDALMSPDVFHASIPVTNSFLTHKDARLSSDLWRRVEGDRHG